MFAEIIAAAANYERSYRTHLRWERQFGYAAAQNWGICAQVPCRGRPSVNHEYSALCGRFDLQAGPIVVTACIDRALELSGCPRCC